MKRFMIFVLAGSFLVFHFHISFAQDGVHVSRPLTDNEVEGRLNEFVRRVVISSVIETTGTFVERLLKNQNIPLYPQIANLSIQQIALQVFKQEELMSDCREAYESSLELLKEQRTSGLSQEIVKNNVRKHAEDLLAPVYKHSFYQQIVRMVIEQSLKEQQRIIILTAAQRQVQMMAVQQQLNQIQQAALQAYFSGIQYQSN